MVGTWVVEPITKKKMEMTKHLGFQPTTEQADALAQLEKFVVEGNNEEVFILRGSAGTGKTSLVKALTEYLSESNIKFFIAAPTGRAAKVISSKTDRTARTLHSLIYTPEQMDNGGVRLKRKVNTNESFMVYIVDEASMVSDSVNQSDNFLVTKPLLSDFIDFVKQGNKQNKILFIGDVYQLPPVMSQDSPALSVNYLQKKFGLQVKMAELKEVKRQDADSYILENATLLRNCLIEGKKFPGLKCKQEKNFTYALHSFLGMFDNTQLEKVIFLALSNRDVNFFNNAVRDRLYGRDTKPELAEGDVVSLHTNWVGSGRMIMKGDSGIVKSVDMGSIDTFAELRFANAQVEFSDSVGEKFNIKTAIMLGTLSSQDGNIESEKETALFAEVMRHNATFRESKMPWDDKYIGAMRLRYGYASTCHKAQGGEWDNVIIHPFHDKNDYRWLYTAVTRARQELYSYAA